VDTLFRLRVLVLTLFLAAPILLGLAGCGSNGITNDAAPNQAVKASEASYDEVIAKQKAASRKAK